MNEQEGPTRDSKSALVARLSMDLRALRAENQELRAAAGKMLDQYQRAVIAGEQAMAGWRQEQVLAAEHRQAIQILMAEREARAQVIPIRPGHEEYRPG
jgi:hypothetical protein